MAQPNFPPKLAPKKLLKLLKSQPTTISALSLFYSSPHYHHSPPIYHHLLRRLAAPNPTFIHHITRIVDLIHTHNFNFSEDIPLSVIKAYSKNSMVDLAFHVFNRMPHIFGCYPGIRSYNSMLNCYVNSNMWDKAEAFFVNYFHVGCNVKPNLETYNILIKISCRKQRFVEAKKLLDWMWDQGIGPDVYSYGTLINGFVKNGELCDAHQVFDEMSERGVCPDVSCYNCLIDGYFKFGLVDEAKAVFGKMVTDCKVYPNVVTYNVMINGLCKCGRVSEGLEFWRRMKANEREFDVYTCSSLIDGLCKVGNVNEASTVFYTTMKESGVLPDTVTCNVMLNGFCKAGMIEESSKVRERKNNEVVRRNGRKKKVIR